MTIRPIGEPPVIPPFHTGWIPVIEGAIELRIEIAGDNQLFVIGWWRRNDTDEPVNVFGNIFLLPSAWDLK